MVHGWGTSSRWLLGLEMGLVGNGEVNRGSVGTGIGSYPEIPRLRSSAMEEEMLTHCTWYTCPLPLLLLPTHETVHTASAQYPPPPPATLPFFTGLEGKKSIHLAVYSTNSDIKWCILEIHYGKHSSFSRRGQLGSVITIDSALGTKDPSE